MTRQSIGRIYLLVAGVLVAPAIHPPPAPAQSAGLEQYRFPAGIPGGQEPAKTGGAGASAASSPRAESPGPGSQAEVTMRILGYPVTTPVLFVAALVLAGVVLRLATRNRRGTRPRRSMSPAP